MIYMRTGPNGSGKTLFTLQDVRDLQLKESRPVAFNGRFKLKPEIQAQFCWKLIDFKHWEAESDGTIFLIDECHNDLPLRPNGSHVPQHVRMLAEHRSRGFDFFLLTQHPMNIDAFVRRIVGAPGWHQHLKRVAGGSSLTRVQQWDAVNVQCEKDGSGETAQVSTRLQPKEVFDWYDSATLHTAKVRIPFQLKLLVACVVIVPLLGWFGWRSFKANQPGAAALSAPSSHGVVSTSTSGQTNIVRVSAADYVDSFKPRIDGLSHTASRYDDVLKPVTAPYPAACVHMGDKCTCYTQQATKLPVPMATCLDIVKTGFFMDWQTGPSEASKPLAISVPSTDRQVTLASK